MKEFEKPIPLTEEIEIVSSNQQEKHPTIGNIVMHRGHTMFEINCQTGEIFPAEYEQINSNFTTGSVRRKIICKPNCLYVPCLNKTNAKKKFAKYVIENLRLV